ncbi:hypothetical protein HZS_648 [Henneguya salminicola]|nr:hypothetical protein HZS_648 [Henneguya salminicola]
MDIQNESEDKINESTLKILMYLDKFSAIRVEGDPNGKRISQVRRSIEKDIALYRELYIEKKKKGGIPFTLHKFIKKTCYISTFVKFCSSQLCTKVEVGLY